MLIVLDYIRNRAMYRFAPAADNELIVFGAAKPKYCQTSVQQWLDFMQAQNIDRVCCLLESKTVDRYQSNLLAAYQQQFGEQKVLWQPGIADFQIPDSGILIENIIPFLISAEQVQQKVVVHCSHGVGRTGIVLAAWLVSQRGLSNKEALLAVRQQKSLPQEAMIAALLFGKNPFRIKQQLNALLNACRVAFK